MIVCHCRKVTDRDLRVAIAAGAQSEAEIGQRTGAGTCCGGCRPAIGEILGTHGHGCSVVFLNLADAD